LNDQVKGIPLNLAQEEVSFIIQVLGELPTKSGAFPLCTKIQQQAQAAAITQAPVTPIPSVPL
jgi:hypothetical protein